METTASTQRGVMLGRGLGVFSIGLGLTELVAPRQLARFIGAYRGRVPGILRLYGVRELAAGGLLLANPTSPVGGWTRVAGDLVDIVSLGIALRWRRHRGRTLFALANVLAVTALDVLHGIRETRRVIEARRAGGDGGSP